MSVAPTVHTPTKRVGGTHRTRTRRAGSDAPTLTDATPAPADSAGPAAPAASAEPAAPPADPAAELDAAVAQLLQVRRGELAEPAGWRRPAHRQRLAVTLAQLQPIRSHAALLSSWTREAARSPEVRLAYAMAALEIDRQVAASRGRRRRNRTTASSA